MSFGLQGIGDASQTDQAQQTQATTSLRPFSNLDLTEDQRTQIAASCPALRGKGSRRRKCRARSTRC